MKRYLFIIQLVLAGMTWAKDLPCGVSVDLSRNKNNSVGSNFAWTVVVVNHTNTALTCRVTMGADALTYNGTRIGKVATLFATNTLAPNTTNTVIMTITPAMYIKYTGATYSFEVIASLEVEGQSKMWIDISRITMNTSINAITVVPTPPIQQGQSLTATVRYFNPLPVSLHNARVSMTVDDGLNGTNNTFAKSSWDIGTVAPNAWISVSTNYVAGVVGTHNISVFIRAKELNEVSGWISVEVIASQEILPARVTLKPEALEVSPGILTAVVRLPEGYPVRGITSATCDGAPCERMMPNEDGTEMIMKFRRQDIEAALAQIGEHIDTNFVLQGTWQDSTVTNFFRGTDSIKKIVGAKSK